MRLDGECVVQGETAEADHQQWEKVAVDGSLVVSILVTGPLPHWGRDSLLKTLPYPALDRTVRLPERMAKTLYEVVDKGEQGHGIRGSGNHSRYMLEYRQ